MHRIKIERLTEKQKEELEIPDAPRGQGPWSVWERGPSAFDWHYEEEEKAYFYEGEVKVMAGRAEVKIKSGDFVTFPKGLACRWEVFKKVRKVYKFV